MYLLCGAHFCYDSGDDMGKRSRFKQTAYCTSDHIFEKELYKSQILMKRMHTQKNQGMIHSKCQFKHRMNYKYPTMRTVLCANFSQGIRLHVTFSAANWCCSIRNRLLAKWDLSDQMNCELYCIFLWLRFLFQVNIVLFNLIPHIFRWTFFFVARVDLNKFPQMPTQNKSRNKTAEYLFGYF